jgi:hypothetical protein
MIDPASARAVFRYRRLKAPCLENAFSVVDN